MPLVVPLGGIPLGLESSLVLSWFRSGSINFGRTYLARKPETPFAKNENKNLSPIVPFTLVVIILSFVPYTLFKKATLYPQQHVTTDTIRANHRIVPFSASRCSGRVVVVVVVVVVEQNCWPSSSRQCSSAYKRLLLL